MGRRTIDRVEDFYYSVTMCTVKRQCFFMAMAYLRNSSNLIMKAQKGEDVKYNETFVQIQIQSD